MAHRIGLMLLGLVFAFIVDEAGLRLIRPIPDDQLLPFSYHGDALARIAAGETYIRFDADLGWVPNPGVVRSEAGVVYEANAAGLRATRQFSVNPPSGTLRVTAFGDSFTYCDEVSLTDCWTTQLEGTWPGSEVLNFGVPGYGPDQAWLRYERDGRTYQPCAVLIGYMPENINRTITRFFPFYDPRSNLVLSKPRFELRNDHLALRPNPITSPEQLADPRAVESLLGPGDDWYFPGMFSPTPFDGLLMARMVRTIAYHGHAIGAEGLVHDFVRTVTLGTAWDEARREEAFNRALGRRYERRGEAFEITARIMLEFARSVEGANSMPIVVIFPGEADVAAARSGQPSLYAPLVERLDGAAISVLDLLQPMALEARWSRTRALFAPNAHYSPHGNHLVATYLARALPLLTAASCGTGAPAVSISDSPEYWLTEAWS